MTIWQTIILVFFGAMMILSTTGMIISTIEGMYAEEYAKFTIYKDVRIEQNKIAKQAKKRILKCFVIFVISAIIGYWLLSKWL